MPTVPPPELPSEVLNLSHNPETDPYAISKFPFKVPTIFLRKY